MLAGLSCNFNVEERARTAFGGAAACKRTPRQARFAIRPLKNRGRCALFAHWGRAAGAAGLAIDSIHHGSTPVGSDENGSAVADSLH